MDNKELPGNIVQSISVIALFVVILAAYKAPMCVAKEMGRKMRMLLNIVGDATWFSWVSFCSIDFATGSSLVCS